MRRGLTPEDLGDLLKLPFRAAYMFRPAAIQPLHGVRSKTAWVQSIYVAVAPLLSAMIASNVLWRRKTAAGTESSACRQIEGRLVASEPGCR